ncbi:MAG: ABC transporter permease [Candidatus Cloacimonetes bacterium]|nr:ABC transporter permease [Candidatus Cloacimonadota bacterium]
MDTRTLIYNSWLVLRLHPLRTFLAMLGIIFGIGAVISMVAVSSGANFQIQKKLEEMGSNYVTLDAIKANEEFIRKNISKTPGLSIRDVHRLKQTFQDQNSFVGIAYSKTFVPYSSTLEQLGFSAKYMAVSKKYFEYFSLIQSQGRSFRNRDFEKNLNVAVVSSSLKKKLDKANKTQIRVHNVIFDVIGAVTTKTGNKELVAYFPISTVFSKLTPNEAFMSLDKIRLNVNKLENTLTYKYAIEKDIDRYHKGVSICKISAPLELLKQKNETQDIFNIVMLSIAFISLLVGGIGIMNIMLANILERIPEIGLRRAVGAKSKDILYQFLLETLFISVCGGVLGLAFGWFLAQMISSFSGMPIRFSVMSCFVSVGTSILVGLIFGMVPAFQATKVRPVEALKVVQ